MDTNIQKVAALVEGVVADFAAGAVESELKVLGAVEDAPDALTELGLPAINPADYGLVGVTELIVRCAVRGGGELYISVLDTDCVVTVDLSSVRSEAMGVSLLVALSDQGLTVEEMFAPTPSFLN